jgi:hypothetical protein
VRVVTILFSQKRKLRHMQIKPMPKVTKEVLELGFNPGSMTPKSRS